METDADSLHAQIANHSALNTLDTASFGTYVPSGHSSALATLETLQPGPWVLEFTYVPRIQCLLCTV